MPVDSTGDKRRKVTGDGLPMKMKTILILTIGLITGCVSTQTYVISEDIADRLYASKDTDIYVEYYADLLYLVQKDNAKAKRAIATILPKLIKRRCSCAHGGPDDGDAVIAMALLNGSIDFHFLDELSTSDKELVLKYFSSLCPVDFGDMLDSYLKESPGIRREKIE